MPSPKLRWDADYVPRGADRVTDMQVALDVAGRIGGAALMGGQPNEVDPEQATGEDPLTELARLTELVRWLTGVRDELLYLTRETYELNERTGPGSWQELADALKLTRTPVRQQYEFQVALHQRGGGLLPDLLAWDARHRKPPTAEEIRRSGRGPGQHR